MQFNQKTLKAFSFDLLHDLEVTLLDTFEAGVYREWGKWLPLINSGIIEKAEKTAIKNKRSTDFAIFSNFKQNIDFADPIELITSLSTKGNEYFNKFFKSPKEKSLLQNSIGEANRFRNLIFHPAGKTLYITDIRDYLRATQIMCNILQLSSLSIRYKNIEADIENSIVNSNHYLKDSLEAIYNNLPKPDYDDWYGLVGRNEIKKDIIEDFQKGYNRIIAITGGGGIGKSALALDISYEFLKPTCYLFKHIIWITSKNNFLDYSGISQIKPEYFYSNNYKDFLNQFISGFYQELFATNLESVTEQELEAEIQDIFNSYSRILCVVDNLENIDDPKILDFIKNKIIPPNFVLITSRNGLGEINKTYKLEPLDDNSAFKLFENLCKYYKIEFSGINNKKLKELLKKTNYYPLVIKWCLSLVANKKMELEAAFSELNKPQNALLEFIFQKLYKQLSKSAKKILRALALYKEIPDRNIIAYIAELETEEELIDAIFELEKHSLISQERIDSKNGIIETMNLLGLAQTFINNITDIDRDLKEKYERRIIEIEQELDKISSEENQDFRPAQKLAQSKLLQGLKVVTESLLNKKVAYSLINEAERLAPRFYLIPYYKALIELRKMDYEYGVVKQYFVESITLNSEDPRVLHDYARLLRKHKKESYKEYAPIFYKAFQLDPKIGYAIDAGIAFHESANHHKAFEVIQSIKEIEPTFPRDNQHKFWTSKTILILAENQIFKNNKKAIELLNTIEKSIDVLSQEKTKEYRMTKAKYCSLLALTYSLSSKPLKAREMLSGSKEIIETYKSVNRDAAEVKEIICYNLGVETILCDDNEEKKNKLRRLENEMSGKHKKDFLVKFGLLIKSIKLSIRQ